MSGGGLSLNRPFLCLLPPLVGPQPLWNECPRLAGVEAPASAGVGGERTARGEGFPSFDFRRWGAGG